MLIPISELEFLIKKLEHEIDLYRPNGIEYTEFDSGYVGACKNTIFQVNKILDKYKNN